MNTSTIQSGINEHVKDDLTNYAYMLGGLDVTRPVLECYDPFKTGFGRIFMIRQPLFVMHAIPTKMRKFKHILEYANTGISGIGNMTVQTATMEGGYSNRQMVLPTMLEDGTNEIQIKTYEFSGSPVREVLHYWITGVMDPNSGLTTYHGALDDEAFTYDANLANHTAEFIYCLTDQSGRKVEYACLFANCFPKEIPMDHLNTDSGDHNTVPLTISFSTTKYESKQINDTAVKLLKKYQILTDSLNFNGKFSDADINNLGGGTYYDISDGKLKTTK